MRKDFREVAGMKIARFGFAYKHGHGWEPGGRSDEYSKAGKRLMNRTVLRFEAQAERARAALADAQYAVACRDFDEAANYDLAVYNIGSSEFQFTEELPSSTKVGVLRKIGPKFVFSPI
jgi:hypothetical protein